MAKRRFERIDRKLLVNYDHFNFDNLKDDEGLARTLDMSVRGLLLQLPRPVEPGSTLRLSLSLGDDVVEAFGEVRRCEQDDDGLYEAGIELRYVPEKFIRTVESFFADQGDGGAE